MPQARAPMAFTRAATSMTLRAVEQVMHPIIFSEIIADIGMIDRHAALIRDQILLRDIGHVIGRLVLGEEMIEGLILARAHLLGDGMPPLLGIREFGVDIVDDTPGRRSEE